MTRHYFLFIFIMVWHLGQGQVLFEESAADRGLDFTYLESIKMGGGAAAFDFDLDGDEDIYVVGGKGSDGLFRNDGNGHFEDVTQQYGIDILTDSVMSTSVVTGDIDNDGMREIFVGTMGAGDYVAGEFLPNLLLRYLPAQGKYENIAASAGLENALFCMGGHFFDANRDGLLDLYVLNYVTEVRFSTDSTGQLIGFDHVCGQNVLYINQGNSQFSDETKAYGLSSAACTLAATSSDIDWDGDPDLIVANDFGKWLTPNQLFQNNGPGNAFSDISVTSQTNAQMYAMGIAVGDFDDDLDFDFYVTNIADNHLFVNNGQSVFENRAEALEVANTYNEDGFYTTGWGAIFEDFNNDSYVDLFVANGYVYSAVDVDGPRQEDQLYLGGISGDFQNASASSEVNFDGPSRGALCADFNQDGLLDLVTITNEFLFPEITNSINYYQNQSDQSNWVGFHLEGNQSNRDAYGAKVIVCADERKLLRELRGGDSHASQNSSRMHFGLGDITEVDSAVIYWPNGLREVISNPQMNMTHQVREGDYTTSTSNVADQVDLNIYPNPGHGLMRVVISDKVSASGSGSIIQSDGQSIRSFTFDTSAFTIDLSGIPPGVYHIEIRLREKYMIQQIVIY